MLPPSTKPTTPTPPTTPTTPSPSPGLFLYEPNASLMKAGMFAELGQRYGVAPLAPNSHLYISEEEKAHFPGRVFQISAISSMNKRELKEKVLPLRQANISARNFPLTVAQLRQKLKLTDGGNHYIFATTLPGKEHLLLIAQRKEKGHRTAAAALPA